MKRTPRHLLSLFVTGLLAALPLAATIAIFWWAASLIVRCRPEHEAAVAEGEGGFHLESGLSP